MFSFSLKKNNKWSGKLWRAASSWTRLKSLWLQRCAGVKQLSSGNMQPSVMESKLQVRRPLTVQTACVTVLCFRKQDLEIKKAWRLLLIAPSDIRRKKKRTKQWKRTWEWCCKYEHKGLFTRRTNWKSTAKLICFYVVLPRLSIWLKEKKHGCPKACNF